MANDYIVTPGGLQGSPSAATAVQTAQWAVAAGSANALTAAFLVPNVALVDGMILGVRAVTTITSTTPTFAPDGLTPYTITKHGGQALAVTDIPRAGYELWLRLNLANTRWELMNPVS